MIKVAEKSIAKRLSIRTSIVLAATFLLLLGGAFVSLKQIVKVEAERYGKSLVGIYSDLVVYEADNMGRPVDVSFSDQLTFFGEYMCTWYRVCCIYSYVPDVENGKVTYLSVIYKDLESSTINDEHFVNYTEDYVLTPQEMDVWNEKALFSLEEDVSFKNGLYVTMCLKDSFGNKTMTGVVVSMDELLNEMMHRFNFIAVFLFLIVLLLGLLIYLFIRKMVSVPARRISDQMSAYVSDGRISPIKLEVGRGDEFSMIAEAFNHMSEDISNYVTDIARLGREQERNQAEVDIAAGIQRSILPYNYAYFSNCSVKAVMKPAKMIGGDLYDYLRLDDSHTMFVIADVSGKGIPASILMSIALISIRQFAKMGFTPAGILKNLNDNLSEDNPRLMFITAFVGIYDSDKGTLTYANAGHNLPYLISDEPVELTGASGTPIGLFPGEEYEDTVVPFAENESVFLYTDGVNEAVNRAGGFYGTDRLKDVLRCEAAGRKHYIEAVEESMRNFVCGAEQNDDISMLSFKAAKNTDLELGYDTAEFSAIRNHLLSSSIPEDMKMDLCVAAEEFFVNICSYAFDGPAPEGEKIIFSLEYSNKVVMRFSDGGRRFDPRCGLPDTEDYDIDSAVGGLGRFIAFTIADSVDYEYRDCRNILTITKTIKK